ncbi:hypothetical protein NL676_018058 [Syzygium grande]|nr:hypothetical protein NL676_018058 [Syzygium grande]
MLAFTRSLSLPSRLHLPQAQASFAETVSQALCKSCSQSYYYDLVAVGPLSQTVFDHVCIWSGPCTQQYLQSAASHAPAISPSPAARSSPPARAMASTCPKKHVDQLKRVCAFRIGVGETSRSCGIGKTVKNLRSILLDVRALRATNQDALREFSKATGAPFDRVVEGLRRLPVGVTLDHGTFAGAAVPDDGSTVYMVLLVKNDVKKIWKVLSEIASLFTPSNLLISGINEAFNLRYGVSQAVECINTIIGPGLVGKDPTEQAAIDNLVQQLNGTVNEQKHIANLAGNSRLVLPVPAFNVINGGSHAGNKFAMQEFMILPVGASSFKEAMRMCVEVYHQLKAVIKKKYGQAAAKVHDTGRFIKENEEGLELLKEAIENADYTDKNNDGSQKIPGDALCNVYKSFAGDYAIVSIEGPFYQDDLEHYARMTDEIGEHVQIVGGDPLGTNLVRLEKAIYEKICNALLLKVDQIGSVTETIEAVKMSKVAGWGVMASCGSLGQQRSIANTFLPKVACFGECAKLRIGETEDAFIADLSVGLATGQIKTGAPRRSERRAIYNRLLQIEKELGAEAVYAGADFRKPVEPY